LSNFTLKFGASGSSGAGNITDLVPSYSVQGMRRN
jgi:hypothetical protein